MFGVCYWKDNRKLGGCLQKEGGVIPYYWKTPVKTNNDEQTITLKLNYNYYRATTKFSWHYPQIDLCVPGADMFSKVLVPIYDRRAGLSKLNKCRMVHICIHHFLKLWSSLLYTPWIWSWWSISFSCIRIISWRIFDLNCYILLIYIPICLWIEWIKCLKLYIFLCFNQQRLICVTK